MLDVLVAGGGAWGTALALQAERAGARTGLWLRNPQAAARVRETRRNDRLPGVALPDSIAVTDDLAAAARLVLLAVPAQHLRTVSRRLAGGAPVVACAKGIEAGTSLLPLEILAATQAGVACAVLSGPNFAHELAAGLPAATVAASVHAGLRAQVAEALGTPLFRIYGNDDPVGVQIGGAAKNVVAIAAGVVTGAGLGENARAALVTRGLAELARLALALGGRAETVAGLSGLGDLLLTCTGAASRNFGLGLALGRGATAAAALAGSSGVVEGVTTGPALMDRAGKLGLDLPICGAVAALVTGATSPDAAIGALLARKRRDE
jgi:glycerol-3-phosphate dehydrogenase (NAD(P)+)